MEDFKTLLDKIRQARDSIKAKNPYLYDRIPKHAYYLLMIVLGYNFLLFGLQMVAESGAPIETLMAIDGVLFIVAGLYAVGIFLLKIARLMVIDFKESCK